MGSSSVKGVGVDKGAVPKHEPVTVTVTPGGIEQDADTWSDAFNAVDAGSTFKPGYPTGPGEEPAGKAKAGGGSSSGGTQSS